MKAIGITVRTDILSRKGEDMSRIITYDSQGNDITCMKEFNALEYPCKECDRVDCEEREEYEKTESRK